jgi:hypothetical protein
VAVCAADTGVVLGQRVLVAPGAAIRYRRGQRLGAGDDHGVEPATGSGSRPPTTGRPGICRTWFGDFSHRNVGVGLAPARADVCHLVAGVCRCRIGNAAGDSAVFAAIDRDCGCRTEHSHFEPARHWPPRCDLRVVRLGLHHPRHVPFANGQRTVPWPMAGRPVLAVLRSGVGYRGGAGQPASTNPEWHPPLADGDVVAASRWCLCLPVGQRLGPGAGGDSLRHAVPGLHATGDATLPGTGAPRHSTQRRVADGVLCGGSTRRAVAGGAEQPFQRRSGSGLLVAGGLLLRPVTAAQGLCANDGAPTAQR